MPATSPMQNAAGIVTNPEAGVMVARPANMPEAAPSTLGLPFNFHSSVAQLKAAGLTNPYETFNWKQAHPESEAPDGKAIAAVFITWLRGDFVERRGTLSWSSPIRPSLSWTWASWRIF